MVENVEESKDSSRIPAQKQPRLRQSISGRGMQHMRTIYDNNITVNNNNETRFSDIEFTLGEESKIEKETTTF